MNPTTLSQMSKIKRFEDPSIIVFEKRTEKSGPGHDEELLKDTSSTNREITGSSKENEKDGVSVVPSDIMALGNADIVEYIASFLNNYELDLWCDACPMVKYCIAKLSLWKKRAQKLAKISTLSDIFLQEQGIEKTFDSKTQESAHFRKLCCYLQYYLKNLANMTVEKLYELNPTPPSLVAVRHAARLAHYNMLGCKLKTLVLENLNLASVPLKHLASLASCVTQAVAIENVCNTDLIPFISNVKIFCLTISRQSLNNKETRALVQAMESRVEDVNFGHADGEDGEVSLDIAALVQYSGEGKCNKVTCFNEAGDKYRSDMSSWAQKINWIYDDAKMAYDVDQRNFRSAYIRRNNEEEDVVYDESDSSLDFWDIYGPPQIGPFIHLRRILVGMEQDQRYEFLKDWSLDTETFNRLKKEHLI